MSCHQYGASALISQTSFRGETSGSVAEMSAVFLSHKTLFLKSVVLRQGCGNGKVTKKIYRALGKKKGQ